MSDPNISREPSTSPPQPEIVSEPGIAWRASPPADKPATCRIHRIPTTPEERRMKRQAFIRKLEELRAQAIAEGMPLLSWDEIEREVAERRGEI